jgi:hypothetical protein
VLAPISFLLTVRVQSRIAAGALRLFGNEAAAAAGSSISSVLTDVSPAYLGSLAGYPTTYNAANASPLPTEADG